jgi:hypothetical protein
MDGRVKVPNKQPRRLLRHANKLLRIGLAKVLQIIPFLYRMRLMNLPIIFFCLSCGWLVAGCAHDDDPSAEHAQHHQHHRGTYGQGGDSDRSGPFGSSTPIPGL